MRAWIDWARNAVVINNAEEQKSSIDLFAQAKPMLVDWGKELQRDEICDAFYALPSESAPAALGSTNGGRVNGLLFDSATAAQRNTWITDNADRVLIGSSNTANLSAGNFATSMANITSAMTLSGAIVNRAKRAAKVANPRIRPYKLKENGTEWFVMFVGQQAFRDAQNDTDIKTANQNSRAREQQGYLKNPIFVDGDLLYNGVIIREIPELSLRLPVFYQTAGSTGIQVAPNFLCGQQAQAWAWGKMPTPTSARRMTISSSAALASRWPMAWPKCSRKPRRETFASGEFSLRSPPPSTTDLNHGRRFARRPPTLPKGFHHAQEIPCGRAVRAPRSGLRRSGVGSQPRSEACSPGQETASAGRRSATIR